MENFKEIAGYDGMYFIGDKGTVQSLKSQKILKTSIGNSGYPQVALSKNGVVKDFMIHRLVAKYFVENPENKEIVNHKNGNKLDASAENLEWCTYKENCVHAHRTGLTPPPPTMRGKFGFDHNRSKAVYEYNTEGVLVNTYGSASEASRKVGLDTSAIAYACTGGTLSRARKTFFSYKALSVEDVISLVNKRDKKLGNRGKNTRRIIYAYNKSFNLLGQYEGLKEAGNAFGISIDSIIDSVKCNRYIKKIGVLFCKSPIVRIAL